ncbi:21663_t:CDS:10 [Gigaspora margarita]|uniref:21663_t:CDS:1 n=1 Tax=Gigaspora margarita TaxID=4874 RepID=A0ABN7VP75_GIGMA|nr:21663_t:CDS:10 [Gigaspora margarita]
MSLNLKNISFRVKLVNSTTKRESFLLKNHIELSADELENIGQIFDADKNVNSVKALLDDESSTNDIFLMIQCAKVGLVIKKERIKLSDELIDKVEEALKYDDSYHKLIDVFNSYGHFFAKKDVNIKERVLMAGIVPINDPPYSYSVKFPDCFKSNNYQVFGKLIRDDDPFDESTYKNPKIAWILIGIPAEVGYVSTQKIKILGSGNEPFTLKSNNNDNIVLKVRHKIHEENNEDSKSLDDEVNKDNVSSNRELIIKNDFVNKEDKEKDFVNNEDKEKYSNNDFRTDDNEISHKNSFSNKNKNDIGEKSDNDDGNDIKIDDFENNKSDYDKIPSEENLIKVPEYSIQCTNRIGKNNQRSYSTITKVKEYQDFINNSSKLSVIFFHSTYCIYSQIVVSVFAELSSRYEEHAKFALCGVVEEALVNAFPTFLFFKNGVEIESLVGADRTKLITLLLKHIKIPRENDENDSNSLQEEHIQSIFKNDDTCLESNDGAELIISIPFNQAIDLRSIKIIPNNIDQAPKEVKIFINRPIILSFDDAEAIRETQKLEFIKADYDNNKVIPLRSVRFQNVTNIVVCN